MREPIVFAVCSRRRAVCSREAYRSARDKLSTKCWGFLLRSSFAILAARTRHLISVARIAAFSVASRLSNSSDIILRASAKPPHVGRLVRASGSKVLGAAMAPKNKSLAQINKSPDVGKATKKCSAQRDDAERKGPNS